MRELKEISLILIRALPRRISSRSSISGNSTEFQCRWHQVALGGTICLIFMAPISNNKPKTDFKNVESGYKDIVGNSLLQI